MNHEENKQEEFIEINDSCSCQFGFKGFSMGKILLGVVFLLLGLFYLGRNLGWWDFNLNWSLLWPIILITLGISVIGNKKISRVLLWVIIFFMVIVLDGSLLSNKDNRDVKQEGVHFFFGSYERSDVENRINIILDNIYKDNDKIDIGVTIEDK